jgi:hypothetical protein
MSDSNIVSCKFRSVVLPYSALEVVGEDWDEFVANLTAAFGDPELVTQYIGMRQFEIKALIDTARTNAAKPSSEVTSDQGVRNVQQDLGGQVMCDAHGKPAQKKVSKSDKNPNRPFWGGCQPGCDFFKWV